MICRVVGSVQTLVAALVCILGLLVGNKSVKQTYKGLAVVYWQIVRLVHNRAVRANPTSRVLPHSLI